MEALYIQHIPEIDIINPHTLSTNGSRLQIEQVLRISGEHVSGPVMRDPPIFTVNLQVTLTRQYQPHPLYPTQYRTRLACGHKTCHEMVESTRRRNSTGKRQIGRSKGEDLSMLLRLKRRRARLLLLLILIERLLGAAVVVIDVVPRVDSGIRVRRAVRVVIAVVALTVGVSVVELVVAGVELVDAVVVWRDRFRLSDGMIYESGAVMLHYVHLFVREPPRLLLAVRLRARRGRGTAPHVTSPISAP